MNKIVKSLAVIAFVAAIAIGATSAYFSDEEKVSGNTITAGTIDISLKGTNDTQTHPYSIADVKPGETGYINYDISNDGTNPVAVSKNLSGFQGSTGVVSEPECTDQGGVWDIAIKACDWGGSSTQHEDINNIESKIIYDLSVKVYKAGDNNTPIWYQTIYTDSDNQTLSQVYPNIGGVLTYISLGMIPVGGHMEVTQSYHLAYAAGNEYQGDVLTFDTTFKGQQLTGADGYAEVILENKTGPDTWAIKYDNYKGTLKYKTQGPVFDYKFTGVAPLPTHAYVLAVGYDTNTNVNIAIGNGTTDSTGNITINGTFDTDTLINSKVWLIPTENWTGSAMNWTGWPTSAANFLWETSLIDYTKN